jgi:hypothetical protein
MNLKPLIICLFTLQSYNAFSQISVAPKNNKPSQYFGFTVSGGKDILGTSLTWNRAHSVTKSKKLKLGYGLRYSLASGKELNFTTAPAKKAADNKTVDTLFMFETFSMSFNVLLSIEYQLSKKLSAGFNIDALGFGFGPSCKNEFISSANNGNYPTKTNARPTSANVLLVGNNDIGQLKSEFYLKYQINQKFGVRLGYDFTFTEYTTSEKLVDNNDRFRYKASMLFLGVTFNPFK